MKNAVKQNLDHACHAIRAGGDNEFVVRLYNIILSRQPDEQGLSYYMSRMAKDMSRLRVLSAIVNSKEARLITNPINASTDDIFIHNCYRLHLFRQPDNYGYGQYIDRLKSGIDRLTILNEIQNSNEARAHPYHSLRAGLLTIEKKYREYNWHIFLYRPFHIKLLEQEIELGALRHGIQLELQKARLEIKNLINRINAPSEATHDPKNVPGFVDQPPRQLPSSSQVDTDETTPQGINNPITYNSLNYADANSLPSWIIAANAADRIAIIPCAFAFEPLYNQRPINAAKYFSGRGYTVIFVAWQWAPDEDVKHGESKVWDGIYQVPLYKFLASLANLPPASDKSSLLLLTLPAPVLLDTLPTIRANKYAIIYDILDEWEAFHEVGQAPWYCRAREEEAVLLADLVTTVSPALSNKFRHLRHNVHIVPNGFDPTILLKESKSCLLANERENIVGYFGHLTEAWFDWELLFKLANDFPRLRFEIIGYGASSSTIERAMKYPNIALLGKVDTSDLHKFARRWSIGLIPFKDGPLSAAVDPIKIYEYIFFGLKIAISGIPHLSAYPNSFIIEHAHLFRDFSIVLDAPPPNMTKASEFLEECNWSNRFHLMETLSANNNYLQALYYE